VKRDEIFGTIEELSGDRQGLLEKLNEVAEIHEAKMLEREEAEAECQEVRVLFMLMPWL
jgi:hypothetical protein